MKKYKHPPREKGPELPIRTDVERYLPDYPIVGEGQGGAGFIRRPGLLIIVFTLALVSGVCIWSFSQSDEGGSTSAKAGTIEEQESGANPAAPQKKGTP